MRVRAEPGLLLPHDERNLGVRLVANNAIRDVHTGVFEFACPHNVASLVEARAKLDEHRNLLAAFSRANQTRNKRRVTAGAIQRLLDGDDLRINGGLLDEPFDRVIEALVRMLHKNVARTDHGKDVGVFIFKTMRRNGVPFRPTQFRHVEVSDVVDSPPVECAVCLVHVLL